jgi:hypothetical protein
LVLIELTISPLLNTTRTARRCEKHHREAAAPVSHSPLSLAPRQSGPAAQPGSCENVPHPQCRALLRSRRKVEPETFPWRAVSRSTASLLSRLCSLLWHLSRLSVMVNCGNSESFFYLPFDADYQPSSSTLTA